MYQLLVEYLLEANRKIQLYGEIAEYQQHLVTYIIDSLDPTIKKWYKFTIWRNPEKHHVYIKRRFSKEVEQCYVDLSEDMTLKPQRPKNFPDGNLAIIFTTLVKDMASGNKWVYTNSLPIMLGGNDEDPCNLSKEFMLLYDELLTNANEKPREVIRQITKYLNKPWKECEKAKLIWLRANLRAQEPISQIDAFEDYTSLFNQYLNFLVEDEKEDVLLFLFRQSYRTEAWTKLIEYSEEYLKNFVPTGEVCSLIGQAVANNGDKREAKEWLLQSIENGYECKDVYRTLGEICDDQHDNRNAVEYFEKGHGIDPSDYPIVSNLLSICDDPLAKSKYCRNFLKSQQNYFNEENKEILYQLFLALKEQKSYGEEVAPVVGDLLEYYLINNKVQEGINLLEEVNYLESSFKADLVTVFEMVPESQQAQNKLGALLYKWANEEINKLPNSNLSNIRKIAKSLIAIDYLKYNELLHFYRSRKKALEEDEFSMLNWGI